MTALELFVKAAKELALVELELRGEKQLYRELIEKHNEREAALCTKVDFELAVVDGRLQDVREHWCEDCRAFDWKARRRIQIKRSAIKGRFIKHYLEFGV
jgi:hypothetical protein